MRREFLIASLLALGLAAPAGAAATPTFSAPQSADELTPPAGSAGGANTIESVACPPSGACVLDDDSGRILHASAGTGAAWSPLGQSPPPAVGSGWAGQLLCPAAHHCLLLDRPADDAAGPHGDTPVGADLDGFDPTVPGNPRPVAVRHELGDGIESVACAASTCIVHTVNQDEPGPRDRWLRSSTPWSGSSWEVLPRRAGFVSGDACPSARLCLSGHGSEILIDRLVGRRAEGSSVRVAPAHVAVTRVSCASTRLCVAIDARDDVSWSSAPAAAKPWQRTGPLGVRLTSIACRGRKCLIGTGDGRIVSASF